MYMALCYLIATEKKTSPRIARFINLKTSVGSGKSVQALDALRKF